MRRYKMKSEIVNKEKMFSGMTIEKLNNGYLVGMLDDTTQRAVELIDSYVFETLEKAMKFMNEKGKELVSENVIKQSRKKHDDDCDWY